MSPPDGSSTPVRKPDPIDNHDVGLAVAAAFVLAAFVGLWPWLISTPAPDRPEPLPTTTTTVSDTDKLWIAYQCYGPDPSYPWPTLPTCPTETTTP